MSDDLFTAAAFPLGQEADATPHARQEMPIHDPFFSCFSAAVAKSLPFTD